MGSRWRHARALVDLAVTPRLERHLLDDLAHVRRNRALEPVAALLPRFLLGDRHRVGPALRIVRANLGADAILERRDDLAARRVVLGIGGEDEQHVERQAGPGSP